ncbi:MAG: dihydrodipicolinate synthase family protein [Clostridia bacterium]|nr:dihydrodipicolinate synthase family protein [Clostridia bacterium]
MAEYKKSEAKEWAREKFRGIENVLMPSFKEMDVEEAMSGLNVPGLAKKMLSSFFPKGKTFGLDETGVKHDVEMCIKHGFFATTVSLEFIALPNQELILRPYYRMVKAAAKGRIILDAYICNATMDENINNIRIAEEEGMDCIMLALPPYFYPSSENDVYEYVKKICDSTNLGVVFYPSHKYNYERFHASRFSPQLIDRIADIPNIVAMKLGVPNLSHNIECIHLCGHKVMLNSPVLSWWPLFIGELGIKWAGSSPFEYLQTPENPRLVNHFNLLLEGKKEEAMKLYWEMTAARETFEQMVMPMVEEGNYNLMHWKYMGWLAGMNGGTIPLSTGRLYEYQKQKYRDALVKSGIQPRQDDREFYVGRVNFCG